jgi:glycosyltransferase involved in cell wall biosynthesis
MVVIGPILMRATVGPMRLLVITARYPTPDRPAAGAFVRDRLAGVEAQVVAPTRYDLPGWRRYLSMTWRALTVRGRFDGVEGHFVLPSGAIALLAARLRGVPLVVYAHGRDVREMAQRNAMFCWLARRVLRGAAAVATNSAETAALVARLGVQAEVIPPGIELSRFAASPRPPERRVLYLGGDLAHKGVDVARQLADTLIGPGIREVDPAEIPALLAAHDVLLVPSLAEPVGLVAAEAIASGRWVVARDVGGLREIVTDGVNGTLVSDADFAAALASVPDYDPFAVAASAERFDVSRQRDAMLALWQRVLGRS